MATNRVLGNRTYQLRAVIMAIEEVLLRHPSRCAEGCVARGIYGCRVA